MKIGLGSTTITPSLETPLAGYYYPRMPRGVHDDLHAKTLLIDNGQAQVVLVVCDLVMVPREVVGHVRQEIFEKFEIPAANVLISANHSHTGPACTAEYSHLLGSQMISSVEMAWNQRVEGSLFVGSKTESQLSHNRRYLMKDGTVITNPGFLNPQVVRPVGPIDPRVGVLYAEDAGGRPLMAWVNFPMHQDTVGGDLISADYSYFLAQTLAQSKGPEMVTLFTMGAAGDINHWDVGKPGPQRGFETAERLGKVLGADVLKAFHSLKPVPPAPMRAALETISLPLQQFSASEVAEARTLLATPPPENVDFTLARVKAKKIATIADHKGGDLHVEVQAIALGSLALVGIPGEPFVELGLQIIRESPFPQTYIVELANDNIGYIPTRKAFHDGGYEPTSSILQPGGGEKIASTAVSLLKRLSTAV